MPVRYYSAGMLVRLAFAIATAIEPEMLLVDEVLGVGDAAFQDKARARMREMMDQAELIVVVSHDLRLAGADVRPRRVAGPRPGAPGRADQGGGVGVPQLGDGGAAEGRGGAAGAGLAA